ncbi:hypothetical protein C8A01DRAFT_35301 [Parachaetomium inaequale]|uniref:Uncharacterized protein n=1 Tax=Parachaetomium inaequale TaxID=2588326 RepID=A0AAN6PIC8_9PEZI|nr:hypothetical protein C8A01DRAFT_35301 [Parachaetomium inaequale]
MIPVESPPFLPLILTCKRLYFEGVCEFFETVTPVFTTSLDAHRFFLERPHPLLHCLLHLELNLTHSRDHPYLPGVEHPQPLLPGVPRTPRYECGLSLCRRDLYGAENWDRLIRGIRRAAPHLQQLDVNVRSEAELETILDPFGAVDDERARGYGDVDEHDLWEVPGRLVVQFSVAGERTAYEQRGRRMVRLELPF